jgi:hypothetical protein
VKTFKGREVSKEVINLGIGGRIEREGTLPDDVPPEALVKFEAVGRYGSVKYKFEDDGTATEMTILTVDAKSFKVLDVAEPVDDQEALPLAGEEQPE